VAADGIFKFIGETVENALSTFVTAGVSNVVGAMTTTALIGVTLYFTIMGYMIIAGRVEAPVQEFTIKGVKIALIGFFALSAGNFTNYVMGGLNGLESGLSEAVSTVGGNPAPANVYEALDNVIDKGLDSASKCFDKTKDADFGPSIGWAVAGMVIAGSTCVLAVIGGVMILLAKLMLSILFVVGPFFILLMMFPATAGFFDKWFGQAMTYVMSIVVIMAVLALAIFCFDHQLDGLKIVDMDANNVSPIFMAFQVLILTVVFSYMISQAGGMAGNLGGGLALASITFGQYVNATNKLGAGKLLKAAGKGAGWVGGKLGQGAKTEAAKAIKARFRGGSIGPG
jgi:type IV secretion system protein VirB6